MIYIHIADGTEEIEFVTIVDILRRCKIEAESVSVSDTLICRGAHNIEIKADKLFKDADYDSCDMIILPGGMPGTLNLMNHKGLMEKIIEFNQNGKYIAAICAAPMILGKAGILNGKKAICYPGFEDKLSGALITDEKVVSDGNIVTSKGPGTAMRFALELAYLMGDSKTAAEVEKGLVI